MVVFPRGALGDAQVGGLPGATATAQSRSSHHVPLGVLTAAAVAAVLFTLVVTIFWMRWRGYRIWPIAKHKDAYKQMEKATSDTKSHDAPSPNAMRARTITTAPPPRAKIHKKSLLLNKPVRLSAQPQKTTDEAGATKSRLFQSFHISRVPPPMRSLGKSSLAFPRSDNESQDNALSWSPSSDGCDLDGLSSKFSFDSQSQYGPPSLRV